MYLMKSTLRDTIYPKKKRKPNHQSRRKNTKSEFKHNYDSIFRSCKYYFLSVSYSLVYSPFSLFRRINKWKQKRREKKKAQNETRIKIKLF